MKCDLRTRLRLWWESHGVSLMAQQQGRTFTLGFAVVVSGVLGFSPAAEALQEIGAVKDELPPFKAGILEEDTLITYQRPDESTYTLEVLKATELGRRIRGADGCIYTYSELPLPYMVNKTCPANPTNNADGKVTYKGDVIDSISPGKKFKFYYTPKRRRFASGCKVRKTVRVRVPAGEFDTYKLSCQHGRNFSLWYLAPSLGIEVAQLYRGELRRELAGLQGELVVGKTFASLPPYRPFGIPRDGDSLRVVANGAERLYTDFTTTKSTYTFTNKTCRTTLDKQFEWAWFTNHVCESGYSLTGGYETKRPAEQEVTYNTRFEAKYRNRNSNDRTVELRIKCKVSGAVRIDIREREIDTYELSCETPYQIHTSWLSPELGRAVADQWYHKKTKRRSIRLFLTDKYN